MSNNNKFEKIRVRYAPSPTGLLHIGNARACLFNYLFAQKNQGSFVIRIEDTDAKRSKPFYEQDIIESLAWLGIKWNEGPCPDPANQEEDIGNYGPYRQSKRSEIYQKYIEKLLEEDKAYHCFCPPEEIEAMRQYQISRGEPFKYNGKCRELSKVQVEQYIKEGRPSVIRFKTPFEKIAFNDLIRGKIEFDASLIGDFVIAKSIKNPLYNLAAVIDDYEMEITHIIRGEDHISNTPKQILLQKALGLPGLQYAHLSLILGSDRSKLSKRHGAAALSEYRKIGYLPEALVNFIAFLGWNPGTEREIFSMASLIKEFSLEKCQKAGAVFNVKRLDFLNGFYIRQKSLDKLTELCLPYLIEKELISPYFESQEIAPELTGQLGREVVQKYTIKETKKDISFDELKKIIGLHQERLKILSEISDLIDFFFKDKLDYPKELLKWKEMTEKEIKAILDNLNKILSKIKEENWTKENLEKILLEEADKSKNRGELLWPLRVALTGKKASAPPFDIAGVLGKKNTLKRIAEAKSILAS